MLHESTQTNMLDDLATLHLSVGGALGKPTPPSSQTSSSFILLSRPKKWRGRLPAGYFFLSNGRKVVSTSFYRGGGGADKKKKLNQERRAMLEIVVMGGHPSSFRCCCSVLVCFFSLPR